MVFGKLKDRKKDGGFTLVELLIVIVVIAILAAITIVAYGNISARAKTTQGQTAAANTNKVAEAINADNSAYPGTKAALIAGSTSTKLPSGIAVDGIAAPAAGAAVTTIVGTSADTASNGVTAFKTDANSTTGAQANTVLYGLSYSGASCTGTVNGGYVFFWDFTTKAVSTSVSYVGSASSTGTVCPIS